MQLRLVSLLMFLVATMSMLCNGRGFFDKVGDAFKGTVGSLTCGAQCSLYWKCMVEDSGDCD